MKEKKLLAVLTAVLAVSGFAGYRLSKQDIPADALTLANVEALTTGIEFNPILECDKRCDRRIGEVCTFYYEQYTFPINCHDMISKFFI